MDERDISISESRGFGKQKVKEKALAGKLGKQC
jgi:hypothetical protein